MALPRRRLRTEDSELDNSDAPSTTVDIFAKQKASAEAQVDINNAESITVEEKSNSTSQLTSNVDSVYSFYGQQQQQQSENTENNQTVKPSKQVVDLGALNDEINASLNSVNSLRKYKKSLTKSKANAQPCEDDDQ